MKEALRLAMAISGGGTTMQAIGEASRQGELKGLVEPVVVIASRAGIVGIAKAQELNIPVEVVLRKDFPKGAEGIEPFGNAVLTVLQKYQPDVVTLNGFLCQISGEVIEAFPKRIFNQHPGPVPDFGGVGMYGRRVHAAVLIFTRLAKRPHPYTEMITQRVAQKYDLGEVVGSASVEITDFDTVDSLQQRALPIEHRVQIGLLKDIVLGRVREMPRETYVQPGERVLLYIAQEAGKALYPQG